VSVSTTTVAFIATSSTNNNMSVSITDFGKDLDEIAEKFKNNVKLSDRSYRLKTYKQCFVGSEAVDYLVHSGATSNREDAVVLGNAFLEMHLIEHVLRDHPFKDEYLFYRFVGENERMSIPTWLLV
jgi:hypothetical protein